MSEDKIRKMARHRVAAKMGFFYHLICYVLVNTLLIVIWAVTGAGYPWFLWALGGWGVGLVFHFFGVFVFLQGGGDWERRAVDKEVEKIKKSQG
jgi:hypothetical protein